LDGWSICKRDIQIKNPNTTISELATRGICAGQLASLYNNYVVYSNMSWTVLWLDCAIQNIDLDCVGFVDWKCDIVLDLDFKCVDDKSEEW
jgi:hypothetical protein